MKLKFLCVAHREELAVKSSYAVRFWQNEYDAAKSFFEQGLMTEAVCHGGCAFEVAEMLIGIRCIDYEVSCDWFCRSALLVAEIFSQLGNDSEAKEILGLTIRRFEQESASSAVNNATVVNYLNRLYSYNSANTPFLA